MLKLVSFLLIFSLSVDGGDQSPPRTDDGLLELVGVEGPSNMVRDCFVLTWVMQQLSSLQVNILAGCGRSRRLGQARHIRIIARSTNPLPMQVCVCVWLLRLH
jgi:hypothetical protein